LFDSIVFDELYYLYDFKKILGDFMTFHDWIFSNYPPNSSIGGQWGVLHILTILVCIAFIVGLSMLSSKSEQTRKLVIRILVAVILFFEVARRIINIIKGGEYNFQDFCRTILPRPWCAIACWSMIFTVITQKKFMYNFSSTISLLSALIFFIYPSVGFNNKYILFENVYSIGTHALLLITSILMLVYGLCDFRYKRPTFKGGAMKEFIALGVMFVYAFVEIFVLKIESNPLYFMPGGEVQEILGLGYGVYLIVYSLFLVLYFNLFYIVQYFMLKNKKSVEVEQTIQSNEIIRKSREIK